MDTGKAKPLRVALTRDMPTGEGALEGEPGGPLTPIIGLTPNKKTQNVPLLEIIAQLNFRNRKLKETKKDDT